MFTETELRNALDHSAGRADGLVADPASGRRAPRRWALPLVAAAAVAAFAYGVVAVTARSHDRSGVADTAVAPPTAPSLVDRAVAGTSSTATTYVYDDVRTRVAGGQTIGRDLGPLTTDGRVVLTVLPGDFASATEVQRGREVAIAGTTGWFARRTTSLLDGQAGGDDRPLPFWTIGFRTPGGDWAFARIDSVRLSTRHDGTYDGTYDQASVDDAARIVRAYDGLDVTWTRDATRQPMRFASLPAGLRLATVGLTVRSGVVTYEQAYFERAGAVAISVHWWPTADATQGPVCSPPALASSSSGAEPACVEARRNVAGRTLTVAGYAPDTRAVPSVLADTTVAADPADYATFAQAISR